MMSHIVDMVINVGHITIIVGEINPKLALMSICQDDIWIPIEVAIDCLICIQGLTLKFYHLMEYNMVIQLKFVVMLCLIVLLWW